MKKITLAVLFGGCSSEHAVSLHSAAGVLRGLDREKYHVVCVGITQDGRWLLCLDDPAALEDGTWHTSPACTPAILSPDRSHHGLLVLAQGGPEVVYLDAVLPILHGKNGEDGTVQGLLQLAGIPVVGCPLLPSALCMDKHIAHLLAAAAGIPVTPSALFRAGEDPALLPQRTAGLAYPLYVKPAGSGSSIGITRVERPEELGPAVLAALEHDPKVVMEQEVDGVELGCAVLGCSELTAGEVDMICLQTGFFDYTEKYNLITAQIQVPAPIPPETARAARELACRVYRALECSGFARVDLFLTRDGRLLLNEVNTIPGFTSHSRYPGMMAAAGLPFSQLLDRMIETAVAP